MRHTFTTWLLEKGERERIIQELLSHSTPFQTSKYMHVLEETTRISIYKIGHLFENPNSNVDPKISQRNYLALSFFIYPKLPENYTIQK